MGYNSFEINFMDVSTEVIREYLDLNDIPADYDDNPLHRLFTYTDEYYLFLALLDQGFLYNDGDHVNDDFDIILLNGVYGPH